MLLMTTQNIYFVPRIPENTPTRQTHAHYLVSHPLITTKGFSILLSYIIWAGAPNPPYVTVSTFYHHAAFVFYMFVSSTP
jgi:hypothetical protein